MKVKNYKFLIVSLLLATGFGSCKKFLEINPDSTIATVNSPTEVSQLLTSAYAKASYYNFMESMSDNVEDGKFVTTFDLSKTNEQSFLFQDVQGSATLEDCPEMYWVESYKAIATCNQALVVCNAAPAGDSSYNAQKGEAYVARAYAHFMLANLFCQFYDASTAATSPGIPYVTVPENIVLKQYERKTVAYVYDMVEKDLLAGLALIKDAAYTVPSFHFNRAAANAFAARFYLYKKDYAKTLKYANDAFPNNTMASKIRPWNTVYLNLTPAQVSAVYTNMSDPANLLITEVHSNWGNAVGDYRYGMTYNKYYNDLDTCKKIAATGTAAISYPFPLYFYGDDSYFWPKLSDYFVVQSTAANIGDHYTMAPLFTVEEVLFNRAEANAYLGNTADALTDLNLYGSKRFKSYNATTMAITQAKINARYITGTDQNNLVKAILNLKRVEFVQEGMRYFDMQRYKMPVTHVHYTINTTSSETITVPASDNRRVLQLPQTAVIAGLALNPR